jgi:hypothetical protein
MGQKGRGPFASRFPQGETAASAGLANLVEVCRLCIGFALGLI